MQAAEEIQPQTQSQTLLRCTLQVQRYNGHEKTSRAVEVHRRIGGKSEIETEVRERKHTAVVMISCNLKTSPEHPTLHFIKSWEALMTNVPKTLS
jgi:hypothetical protein